MIPSCVHCHRVIGDIHSQDCRYDSDTPRQVEKHHCDETIIPGIPYCWNCKLNEQETEDFCLTNNLKPIWNVPVKEGDYYIAKRNTGFKLLQCRSIGQACVHPNENAYSFDFSECVKVELL